MRITVEISLTLFNSIFDNKTTQRLTFKNFDGFEKALYGLSKRKIKSKKDAPLMSPACYKPDTTRKNDNVTMWSSCLLYTSPSPRDKTVSRMPSSA